MCDQGDHDAAIWVITIRGMRIPRDRYEANREDLAALRRIAGTPMTIDVSKHEFVDDSVSVEISGFVCRVYSKRLIVAEKLRALAQQRPETFPPRKRTARARDFFDIQQVLSADDETAILGEDFIALVKSVFAAKQVSLDVLDRLPEDRSFHAADWRSVLDTAGDPASLPSSDFDFYFDFVMSLVSRRLRSPT